MKRLSSVLFTLAFVAGASLARPAQASPVDTWCNGGLRMSDGAVQCVVDQTIVELPGGKTLREETLGVVRSVRIQGTLSADLQKLPEYLHGNHIDVPEQTLSVTIETVGAPLNLVVTLAPSITLEQRGGAMVVTDISLNVSSIKGDAPPSLNAFFFRQLNTSRPVKDAILRVLNQIFGRH